MAQALERRPEEQRLRGLATEAARAANELRVEQSNLQPLLKRVAPLASAEARIAELQPQHATLWAEQSRLVAAIDALPPGVGTSPVDVEGYRRAAARAEVEEREAQAAVVRLEQRLEQAKASQAIVAELGARKEQVEAELSDWTRLAGDLGREGLQALTIDAAIPELVTTANELLHSAFGPRFTVDIRTQSLNSTGKKMLETLDVVVIDTERGRELLAERLSGGERVIVSEALSLALTALACRQNGVERPTIFRDESGAALSSAHGKSRQWVAMLRRAATLIGAERIVFDAVVDVSTGANSHAVAAE